MGTAEVQRKVQKKVLKGKIALVAGATRGAGRGIAVALGEAGATVYCNRPQFLGSIHGTFAHTGRT